jgi:hypothetical protein
MNSCDKFTKFMSKILRGGKLPDFSRIKIFQK